MERMRVLAAAGAAVAFAGAIGSVSAAAQDFAYLSSNLFGDYVDGGGAGDAEGDFNGEADLAAGRLCYYLEFEGLDDADGVAIHQAAERTEGPQVLSLTLPAAPGEEVCVTVEPALLGAIAQDPAAYYLLVRNPSHPNGAIRGQFDG